MRTITCPRCGATIPARPYYKPFCARCGWNLERAELAVAGWNSATTIGPLLIGVVAVLMALFVAQKNPPVAAPLPLAVGAVMLIPFWSRFSMRKAIAAAKFTVNPGLALARPPVDTTLQQLQALPRPRKVKLRFGNAWAIVLVASALLGFVAFYVAAHPTRTAPNAHGGITITSPLLIMVVFFVILFVVPFFRDKKAMPLMRDGELALGRVTFQQNVSQGKSSYSRIGYEFKTSSGQLIQDQAKDLTFSVYEDMTIPVFYDPQNPSKNVTPCATYLRVSTEPF